MIKIILKIFFIFSVYFASTTEAYAQTKPTDQIDELKEKIASKVAQIEPEKIILRGKVEDTDTKSKTFILVSKEKKIEVAYLSNTAYFWIKNDGGKLSLNFTNVAPGDDLAVIGTKTIGEDKMAAETIIGKAFEKNLVARIIKIDDATKRLDVKTLSSDTPYTIDLNNILKYLSKIKKGVETSINFSDLKADDIIVSRGLIKDPQKNTLTAKTFFLIQN